MQSPSFPPRQYAIPCTQGRLRRMRDFERIAGDSQQDCLFMPASLVADKLMRASSPGVTCSGTRRALAALRSQAQVTIRNSRQL